MESTVKIAALLSIILLCMMGAGAISSLEPKLARNAALFGCIVAFAIAIWFIIFQKELG
jgi:hypothetical protein